MFEKRQNLLDELLRSFPQLLVAYSGGVDSACLLAAAYRCLGSKVLGVLADSPSLPRTELKEAIQLAKIYKLPLEIVQTEEFKDDRYLENSVNRCYFCKHALFDKMEEIAKQKGFSILAYGENADDLHTERPGSKAAMEFQVRSPLKEAGLTKADVRLLAKKIGLSVFDKPSSPCLSSRIPHGTPVTLEALEKIEKGEAALKSLGFQIFRVRHNGTKAKVEFGPKDLRRAQDFSEKSLIRDAILKAGYQEVEIDPQGYKGVIH